MLNQELRERAGAELRGLRRQLGVSTARIAQELGCTPEFVRQIERGQRTTDNAARRYLAAVEFIASERASAARDFLRPAAALLHDGNTESKVQPEPYCPQPGTPETA